MTNILDPIYLEALRSQLNNLLHEYLIESNERKHQALEHHFHWLHYNDEVPTYKEADLIYDLRKEVKELVLTLSYTAHSLSNVYCPIIQTDPEFKEELQEIDQVIDRFQTTWSELKDKLSRHEDFYGCWRYGAPLPLAKWYEESIQ